jgi:hypothetical protein
MRLLPVFAVACLLTLPLTTGCEGDLAMDDWFANQSNRDEWTIECVRVTSAQVPDPMEFANQLGEMMAEVRGLRASKVRVEGDSNEAVLYYGTYTKVADRESGQLAFPEQFQRDIQLIRGLSSPRVGTPFLRAKPSPIPKEPQEGPAETPDDEWNVVNAPCTHSLLIAVFYNTPTFDQRREVAEEYARQLRAEGITAYYYHEPVKSFVFAGEFGQDNIIQTKHGAVYGPEVQRFVDSHSDYLRYFTENGHIRSTIGPSGEKIKPETRLIPIPRPY